MTPTVLVVDDDAVVREVLAAVLGADGFAVVTADGPTALAAVRATDPAVIVLDLMMPVRNGWEVLRDLRDAGSTAPVLLFSAYLEAEQGAPFAARALAAGVASWLPKGQLIADLVPRVRALLEAAHAPPHPPHPR